MRYLAAKYRIIFYLFITMFALPLPGICEHAMVIIDGKSIICTDITNNTCFSCSGARVPIGEAEVIKGDFKCPDVKIEPADQQKKPTKPEDATDGEKL